MNSTSNKNKQMTFRKETRGLAIVVMGFTLLGFQNCGSAVSFSGAASNNSTQSTGNPPSTTTTTQTAPTVPTKPCTVQTATNLKVIFIVDDSGSTDDDDPQANVRANSALAFIKANPALSYNYSWFATGEGSYDYTTGKFTNNSQIPLPATAFANATMAETAVTTFQSTYTNTSTFPNDSTNYDGAFGYVQSLVVADEAANPGSNYAVIFMSDGQPNDGNDSGLPAVQGLMKAAGAGRLTVSTLYFNTEGNTDPDEASLMAQLAAAGLGQYANATLTNSAPLNITTMVQSIITVPTGACTN